jgi:hypothetical protein
VGELLGGINGLEQPVGEGERGGQLPGHCLFNDRRQKALVAFSRSLQRQPQQHHSPLVELNPGAAFLLEGQDIAGLHRHALCGVEQTGLAEQCLAMDVLGKGPVFELGGPEDALQRTADDRHIQAGSAGLLVSPDDGQKIEGSPIERREVERSGGVRELMVVQPPDDEVLQLFGSGEAGTCQPALPILDFLDELRLLGLPRDPLLNEDQDRLGVARREIFLVRR